MQSRARWTFGLGAAVLLAGLGGWLWLRQTTEAAAVQRVPALAAAASGSSAAASAPAGAAIAPAPARDPADRAWCALRSVEPQADEQGIVTEEAIAAARAASPADRQFEAARRKLRQDWARWLAAGDERSRALGLYLQDEDEPGARERLAALARQTRDPAVYALAYLNCTRVGEGCQGISARQWAALEPDNLQAWLREAGEAEQRGDAQALQEAVWRMGRATRSESWVLPLMARLQQLPRSTDEGLRQSVEAMEPYRWVFRDAIPNFRAVSAYCKSAAAIDTNRAQACGEAAEAMWTTGGDLISRAMAIGLSKALPQGAPVWAPRVLERGVHQKALMALQERQFKTAEEEANRSSASACAAAEPLARYWQQLVSLGEWGIAEQELARSSEAERAALERQVREELMRHLDGAPRS